MNINLFRAQIARSKKFPATVLLNIIFFKVLDGLNHN